MTSQSALAAVEPSASHTPRPQQEQHAPLRGRPGSVLVPAPDPVSLRVLLASERVDHMELVAGIVRSLGHQVIATEIDVSKVGALTVRERPDVALVARGESTDHALELIGRIVHASTCPVIAVLSGRDRGFIESASQRGIFAYTVDSDAEALQAALDITLCRFSEYQLLQDAFGRRALIERAKGIVMERHQIAEPAAFELLRHHSREHGRKLIEVSQSIVDGHTLLPATPRADAPEPDETTAGPTG